LVELSTLIDLLQESRAQAVGHLENSSEHPLGQGVEVSAFIGVHQRPSKVQFSTKNPQDHYWPPMNTDERRFSDEPKIRLPSYFLDTTLGFARLAGHFVNPPLSSRAPAGGKTGIIGFWTCCTIKPPNAD